MQYDRNFGYVMLGFTRTLLLAIPLCANNSHAQQVRPEISYEGQPVASIHLVAAPQVDLRRLRPLVKLQAGQPYSEAKARAAASALRSAGPFERVDVQIVPDADGLRVSFLLQPVYYLGLISFSNPVSRFDYARLRQAVNYPDETPYEPDQVQQGANRLKGLFVNEGYFLAQVHEHAEFDTAHKLANITYDIVPGRHAKFGQVRISGPPPAEQRRMLASLHSVRARLRGAYIRPGKTFSPQHVSRASEQIQSYLGNHGWLASHVAVAEPQYNPETNRVPIHFQVTLGPKVQIRITGAKVHRKTLKKIIPIYEERSFDQELVTEGARDLAVYFQSKGYFDAKVTPKVLQNPSEILLTYQVQRGPRHKVLAIRYTGNRSFDEDKLDEEVAIQLAHFFSHGNYSQALMDQSVNNLKNFYYNAGFESVGIQAKVSDVDSKLTITFHITEGPRTVVNSLKLTGFKTQTIAKLVPNGLELRAGRPYSPAAVARDRNRIVAAYLNLGYPQVSLQATSTPVPKHPHQLNVTYTVHEGPEVKMQRVLVLGAHQTRPEFILSNTDLQAGDPMSQQAMLQADSALYGLGIFDWATVAPARPVGQGPTGTLTVADPPHAGGQSAPTPQDQNHESMDVLVKVHESSLNSIAYGFGFLVSPRTGQISTGIVQLPGLPAIGLPSSFEPIQKSVFSPQGSFAYTRKNLRGRDETASVSTVISRLDQRLTFTHTVPQFHGPLWTSLFNFSVERTTQNPLFSARLGQASLQFDRALNSSRTARLQFRYIFERTSLTNLLIQGFVPPEDRSIQTSTLSVSFIHDTRDDPLDAHRGVFETVDFGLTPTLLGSSDNFARLFGQVSFYRQMRPWLVWANRVETGVVGAFAGSHVPLSERFFSGGADSLRGFAINAAGPQTTGVLCTQADDPSTCTAKVLLPTGGPQLFILNSEGRFPIHLMRNLSGVIFYDGGNIFDHIGFGRFFSQYSNTLGLGFRYNTPVGPIRVDIGRNLNPTPGLKATQVFVTLGQAF